MKTLKLCLTYLGFALLLPNIGFGACTWSLTSTPTSCGNANGTITLTPTGQCINTSFTVVYNGGLPYMTNSNPMTNLPAGFYQIYSGNFLVPIGSIYIGTINDITITPGLSSINQCANDCTASLSVSATSSSGIASYQWNNGGTTNAIYNLCAGTYRVTVTNNDGCHKIAQYNVGYSSYLNTSLTSTNNTCPGACAGTATTSVSSNSGVSYDWSNGATSSSVSNLCNGNYDVTITNAYGCQSVESFSIITDYSLNTNWQKTTENIAGRNDVIKRTLLDDKGNLFIMGEFEVKSNLEGMPLTTFNPNQKTGIFVARYSSCGVLDWVSQLQNQGNITYNIEAFDLDFDASQSKVVVFGKWDNYDPNQKFTWIDGNGDDHTPANPGPTEDVFATAFNAGTGAYIKNESIKLDFEDRLTTGKSTTNTSFVYIGGQIQSQASIISFNLLIGNQTNILQDNNQGNIVSDFILDGTELVAALNLEQSAANITGTSYGNQGFALMVRTSNTSIAIPSAVIHSGGKARINDIDISEPGTSFPLVAVGTFEHSVPGWSTPTTVVSSSIPTALIAQFDLSTLAPEGTYMLDGNLSEASAEAVHINKDLYVVTGWAEGTSAKITGNNGSGTGNLTGFGRKSMWATQFIASNGNDTWLVGSTSSGHIIPHDIVYNFDTEEFYTVGSYLDDINLPTNNGLQNPTPGQGNTDGFLVRGLSSLFSASYYKNENNGTVQITETNRDTQTFTVYPNPSNGYMTIEATGLTDDPATLKVFSITGQLLWTTKVTPLGGELDTPLHLTQLKTGLYTLQLIQNEQLQHVKLLIE